MSVEFEISDVSRPLSESRFDELFSPGPDGFGPRWRSVVRDLLITS
ncbi:MAG: hypothetical protein O3A93_11290 [Chloroflexi bacterium]|nr:hypothetical protein [Chloroflexota bacterium]MDA1271823.1 hypothetical protein [Chloroflexota bacterium]